MTSTIKHVLALVSKQFHMMIVYIMQFMSFEVEFDILLSSLQFFTFETNCPPRFRRKARGHSIRLSVFPYIHTFVVSSPLNNVRNPSYSFS